MLLPSNLLQSRLVDVTLKQVANTPFLIHIADGKTETGGLELVGSVDQTITTGGTTQILTNWTDDYQEKVAAAVPATGVVTTTTATTFTLNVEGKISRKLLSGGKIKLTLVSSKDGILDTFEFDGSPNKVVAFTLAHTGALTATANAISVNISGDTITSEVFSLSDAAFYLESAA